MLYVKKMPKSKSISYSLFLYSFAWPVGLGLHHGSPMIKCMDRMWITASANENSGTDLHHSQQTSLSNVLRGSKTRGSAAERQRHMSRGRHQRGTLVIFLENRGETARHRSNDEWRRKAAEPSSRWGEAREGSFWGRAEDERDARRYRRSSRCPTRFSRSSGVYGSTGIISGHASARFSTLVRCLTRQHQAL